MAGDWIKIRKDLPEDPGTIGISGALGITPDETVGLLVRFWRWVDSHVSNSDALGVTKVTLDYLVSRPGFANALLMVGWLQEDGEQLSIPHFERHLSKSAKRRALGKNRQEEYRYKGDAGAVTKTSLEKRREDDDDIPSGMSSQLADKPPSKRTPAAPTAEEIIARWNELAERHDLPPIKKVCAGRTDDRRRAVGARLKEIPDLWEQLDEALGKRDAWARGHRFPAFDQAMTPRFLTKLLEGSYDDHEEQHKQDNTITAWRKAEAERRERLGEAADVME